MGGAGTAAGNDSAMPYLNPAGIAGLPLDVFAVSASIYGYSQRSFGTLLWPSGLTNVGAWQREPESTQASHVTDIPSSVMYFKHLPGDADMHHMIGLALIIPSRERLELQASGRVTYLGLQGFEQTSIGASIERTEYYIGPCYSLALGDDVRLGASVFARYAQTFRSIRYESFTAAFNQTTTFSQNFAAGFQDRAESIVPVVGVQFRLYDDLWAGAAIAVPSLHLRGSETGNSQFDSLAPSGTATALTASRSSSIVSGSYKDQSPLRLNAGLAWDDRSGFSAAADAHLFLERSGAQSFSGTEESTAYQTGEIPRDTKLPSSWSRDLQTTVDISAGVEVALSESVSLRAGGFTDFTNLPPLDLDNGRTFLVREQRFGGTLGVGVQAGSFDSTTGLVYTHGSGKIATVDPYGSHALAAVDTQEHSILVVFSGAVTLEEARETINEHSPVQVPQSGGLP